MLTARPNPLGSTTQPCWLMFEATEYFDLAETEHDTLFESNAPVWTALGHIASYLEQKLTEVDGELIQGSVHPTAIVGPNVYLAEGAAVEAKAVIQGPAWIGAGTVVRSGAYLRNNVIAGENCTLGNSCEFKNCLLFNNVEVPHFNYVGDAILGHKAHLGAGVICSNVRLDRRNVVVRGAEGQLIDTGLRKLSAIVGDRTEIGCNSVLSPGSILGKDCILYPLTHWQGVLDDAQIVKTKQPQDVVARRMKD